MANLEVFEAYFKKADLDQDGKVSGAEAVAFFQGSNLPKPVLAQIWMHADQNRTGFLGRQEFYNALKLVTVAQSGRELAPEIVKSALYGPAAAKIPAPKINTVPLPATQMGSGAAAGQQRSSLAPSTQMGSLTPTQNLGFKGPQAPPANVGLNQQLFSSNTVLTRPPQSASSPQMLGVNQGLSGGGGMAGPQHPSTKLVNLSTDWLGNRIGGASAGGISQSPLTGITPSQKPDGFGVPLSSTSGMTPRPQTQAIPSSSLPPKPLDSAFPPAGHAANGSKALVVSGNGFSSASNFGGDVFSAASQTKASALPPTFPANSMTNTSTFTSAASGSQNLIKLAQLDPLHSTPRLPPGGSQLQPAQSIIKQDQNTSALAALNISAGPASSASGQSQPQWPKIAQADIQKYTKVFVEVDKDRDGKITGEQARNLFLSWRLPREVLKQVWDLSDQDNDSMLSLREFCIALYLMERFREGRPLPAALPDSLRYDETLLRATGLPSTAYGGPTWQTNPGLSQGIPGARPLVPNTGARPPTQAYMPQQTGTVLQPGQQKSRMPAMDNHMANQVNRNEQSAASSEYQAETDTDRKVQVMEKHILDSKEKIEFYRTKMQELVLYRSRCDNRLNEITERASADRHEVESLGKKYEEKYKQVGEVASKLAVEEATFRHVQERKVELQNAIVKMEQGGSADGLLQVRADRIQYDLEELEKALGERCKHYGLHVKPTTSIELPFGWQPGAQEGAADWDENWDKFEDEGFVLAKGLNAEVENIVSHDNARSSSVWDDRASMDGFSPVASSNGDTKNEKHYSTGEQMNENYTAYEHSEEESARSPDSPGRSTESPFHSSQFGMHDISPRSKGSHRDHVGAESTLSGDKYADDPSWNFDDADSVWGSSTIQAEDANHQSMQNSFSGDFGLNPVRVDSPSAGSVFGKKKSPFFEDSVPGSPLFSSGVSPKFNESHEDNSFNNFGRFDSFRTEDSGFFPQEQHFSKFDSISSSRGEQLTRFDSVNSSRNFGHSRGFESFDEADPFGASGPFKSSGSHSPPRF
ncbi:uncharacterized protein [Typha latifolia]|uniref:uncharacterized protein n=1 Tax=Typha latifolia TaxID=4733 RepID=UPI003C2E20C5